jgi:hypothetical protein
MATYNTNIINITNLPQAQDIVNGNFLLVQNDLGTQIIDWANVYVLKLDPAGNGGTSGSLSALSLNTTTINTNTLTASNYFTNGLAGQSYSNSYLNTFTFTNGLLTSGSYVNGSPEYQLITTSILPAATSYSANLAQPAFESYGYNNAGYMPAGVNTLSFTFTPLPSQIAYTSLNASDFNVVYTGTTSLSAQPYVSTIALDGNSNLLATVNIRQNALASQIAGSDFVIKVMKRYTIS